jgi:predicted Zn-dependent protease
MADRLSCPRTARIAYALTCLLLSCSPAAADDVALGTEAAATVRARVPLVKDEAVIAFVAGIGRRLVDALPDSARQPAFTYSFDILDEIYVASYGLPGGPVFVSRGFLQRATTERDVAEGIARAISHIALRHGAAQATSGETFELGPVTGADIGAVIAGPQYSILAQGAGFGVALLFPVLPRRT